MHKSRNGRNDSQSAAFAEEIVFPGFRARKEEQVFAYTVLAEALDRLRLTLDTQGRKLRSILSDSRRRVCG